MGRRRVGESLAVSFVAGGVVFECPGCGERLDESRCPDCNLFCRRLGRGGCCSGCGEMVTVEELGGGG
jgi:hypothetical protein